jgi:integrase/recombinase XerD
MRVTMYRKHNHLLCSSKDTQVCKPVNSYCPIYIRGAAPDGQYVRGPIKAILKTGFIVRDWKQAQKLVEAWESSDGRATAHVTVTQWRKDYLALATKNNLSPETIRKYKHLFTQMEAFATKRGVELVKSFDLQATTEFRLSWVDGPLSASKKLERLRSVMTFAVDRDWLPKNFASMIAAPKVEPNPTLPFTKDEMSRIIAAAKKDQRTYTFILVMRSSGLRISDVTKLAVKELKDNRLFLYQAKTGEPVSILLDPLVADALRAVVPLNRNKDYFFWTGKSPVSAAASNWRLRIADVFKAAKIANGHTHRFRDTFAVGLLERGATIANVSRLLGHTSIKITEKHYNPWVKSRQDALDADLKGANGWLTDSQAAKDNVRPIARKA